MDEENLMPAHRPHAPYNMDASNDANWQASQAPSSREFKGDKMFDETTAPEDADTPMNWPILTKIYVSSVAFAFTFALLFAATCYTSAVTEVVTVFNVSMRQAVLPFSLFIFGIIFAPTITPHLTEKVGRTPVYFASAITMSVFLGGAGASNSFTALAVCRFFAGFCGGPSVVLIEGTFADVWPALYTGTYYAVLTLASYTGAGLGPIIGGYLIADKNWRWTQWVPMMFVFVAILLGIGVPETFPRQRQRRLARSKGISPNLPPAQSGETLLEMARLTVFHPFLMFFTEPLVIMVSLCVGVNFAVLFSWFIAVPAVLATVYAFTIEQIARAFTSAIAGAVLGAIFTILLDTFTLKFTEPRFQMGIERRLIPSVLGNLLLIASLFWIGFTAKPTMSAVVPIIGTGVYVMGSAMSLIGFVSYLFDAYPAPGTLSALTTAAYTRVFSAGIVPLFIIAAITNLGGGWALSIFGFINVAFLPFPIIIILIGAKLRGKSRFGKS